MLRNMDLTADPCQDFFRYSCGRYESRTEIPEYLVSWSHSWDETRHKTIERTIDLLEADKGDAGAYFQSCMNREEVEKLGTGPLTMWMQAVDEVKDRASLSQYLATIGLYNMENIFDWEVATDALNPGTHMLRIGHTSLSLPGSVWYTSLGKKYQARRENLLKQAKAVFEMIGLSSEQAGQDAEDMLAVETTLARHRLTLGQIRARGYARMGTDELEEICTGVDWPLFFDALGMSGVNNGTV